MDCAACGKPISVTAKFCGKCGAPVKRPAKAPEAETAAVAVAETAHDHGVQHEQAHDQEHHLDEHAHDAAHQHDEGRQHDEVRLHDEGHPQQDAASQAAEIEGLVVTLTPALPGLDSSQMLDLDLNLESIQVVAPSKPTPSAAQSPAPTAQATDQNHDKEWLQRLEQHQHELKKTLEKHSLLLDFISLASQQQSHQQAQPNPSEDLLHNLIEQQTQFAVQLAQVQNHLKQTPTAAPGRLPEELKLLLEKQRIEIQKSFSQGIAQNTENLASAQQADMTRVQEMLTANTLAAQAIEKNLTPLIQSVNDLKTKVQAVVKKVDELPAASRKSGYPDDSGDKQGGGAMIFVIGMLCGLTVVLSSLAIYNFLSHDSEPAQDKLAAHEPASNEISPAHDSGASHDSPAHDKPAEHSAKDKAH